MSSKGSQEQSCVSDTQINSAKNTRSQEVTLLWDETRQSFKVSGPGTYPLREKIKALSGSRFWGRGATSYWSVPGQHKEALEEIVSGAESGGPGQAPASVNRGAARLPAISRAGPRAKTQLEYPATFRGGDGLEYQVAIYTVPLPVLGQSFTLGEDPEVYIISDLGTEGEENTPLPVDKATGVWSEDASCSVEIELRRGSFYSTEGKVVKFRPL